MLEQILWRQKPKLLIAGATVAAFVGLLMLLVSLQFYLDVRTVLAEKSEDSNTYLLLNKRVSLLNTLGAKSFFTAAELSDLAAQGWAKQVAGFTANRYKVSAQSAQLHFITDLFFESVPDAAVDVSRATFRWREGDEEVPIVLAKDYLALYNFGFAPSQGLPQFTASTITRVPFEVRISGRGQSRTFRGRVVGFSAHLNSILVPQSFMEYANRNYGDVPSEGPSRAVVAVENPNNALLKDYLEKKGYEVSNGRLFGGELMSLIALLTAVVATIGGIIVGLSLLVFLLNFQLIVAQSAADIRLLLQIGYRPAVVAQVLERRVLLLYVGVVVATVVGLFAVRYSLQSLWAVQGFAVGLLPSVWVWCVLGLFSAGFVLLNVRSVRQSVARCAV